MDRENKRAISKVHSCFSHFCCCCYFLLLFNNILLGVLSSFSLFSFVVAQLVTTISKIKQHDNSTPRVFLYSFPPLPLSLSLPLEYI